MDGWEHSTLGEVLSVLRNGLSCKQNKDGIGQPISRIETVAAGVFDLSRLGYAELSAKEKARHRLQHGDILFSHINSVPHVGKTAVFKDGAEVFHGMNLLLMRPMSGLEAGFLNYYLKSLFDDGYWRTRCKRSVNQASVNQQDIKRVPIPLPPLPEQERIVAILDEAFAAIATATANTDKNLANARELFESYRNGLLEDPNNGWAEEELGQLTTIKHGFAFKSEGFVDLSDHVLLTPGSFFEGGGYRDRGAKQKYYAGEIPSGYILSRGDLLLAMTEQAAGLLGSPLIVPESDRFLHNQRLGLVQALPDIPWCSEFFFHVFNTFSFRRSVHADASGVKVRHTSPKKMYRVRVRYPESAATQRSVASRLNDMHDECLMLASGYKRKAEILRELKQSILHNAFTGELTKNPETAYGCPPPTVAVG